jgi:hypothetical protein
MRHVPKHSCDEHCLLWQFTVVVSALLRRLCGAPWLLVSR